MSNLLGLIPVRRDTSIALGSSSAPAARLFMKSESSAVVAVKTTIRRVSDCPEIASTRRAIQRVTPVLSRQRVMMNRLISVMTTDWLNPDIAFAALAGVLGGPSTPNPSNWVTPNAAAMSSAATSTRRRSVTTNANGMRTIAMTRIWERVTLCLQELGYQAITLLRSTQLLAQSLRRFSHRLVNIGKGESHHGKAKA